MSLTYIRGRSGSGKTAHTIQRIKTLIDKNPLETIYVIVPEQATFRMERELADACGNGGLFGISVLSFDRLVHLLINQFGGGDTPIDFIGKTMIVRTILDENRDQLTVFKRSAAQPGFEIKITEQLSELKRQDVSLADLTHVKDSDIDETTQQKLSDLCLLYRAYQNKLSPEYMDDSDLITLAIDHIKNNRFFENSHIFADGFDLLTNQLLQLLILAIKQAKSSTITLRTHSPSDTDSRVFDPELKLFNMIDEAAKTNHIKSETIDLFPSDIRDTRYRSTDIYHLEHNLFAYPFKIYQHSPHNIILTMLESRALEVKDTCAHIIDLIASGYRFRDIAVCVSDIRQYKSIITSIFIDNQIPYFMDAKTKLLDTAAAEFLVGLLDFLVYKDIEDFLVYMKAGFIDIPDSLLYAIENHIRTYQLKGYQLDYPFSHGSQEAEQARQILSTPVFGLIKKIDHSETADIYGNIILDFLKSQQIDQQIETFANELESDGDFENALVFAQVFEKIIDVLSQTCHVFKSSKIPFASFVSAVKAGLEAAEIAIIPPSTDDVLIGDFSRTVFPDCKVLLIMGINDGKIPSSPDTTSILTDHEKIALEKQGIRAGYRDRFFEERLKIYTTFAKPSEKLFLSYALSNAREETKPSVLIGRINRIFPKLDTLHPDPKETVYPMLSKNILFNALSFALSQKLDGLSISDDWRSVYENFVHNPIFSSRLENITQRLLSDSPNDAINKSTAASLYQPLRASVSRAERYYVCPFLYFMDYGIRPQKQEPFEATPLDIGTFLHDCMHKMTVQLKKDRTPWRTLDDLTIEKHVNTITENLKETYKNGIFKETERFTYVFNRLKLDFMSAAKIIRDQLSGTDVDIYKSELTLKNEDYLSFSLPDGTSFELTCKIDRIDSVKKDDTRIIRIIDYKSSAKQPSLKELYYGLTIQLMIYLKCVIAYFNSRGETVVIGGALYFDLSLPQSENASPENLLKQKAMRGFITNDTYTNMQLSSMDENRFIAMMGRVNKDGSMSKQSGITFSTESFNLLFEYCEQKLTQAMTDILDGTINPMPYLDKESCPCDRCDYTSVCGFDRDTGDYRVLNNINKKDFGIEE